MSALGASQNPLYVVEYRLPVPELPTTTVTTLLYGVSSRSSGLASTGGSASSTMRSIDSKVDRTRPVLPGVSGSPLIRVRSVRWRATAA